MRRGSAHRAADVPDAVYCDLAGASGELLQDVRAGAQGEGVGPADLASLQEDVLLDEVPPRGVGVEAVPTTAEKERSDAARGGTP